MRKMDAKEALGRAIENLQTNSIWYEKDTQREIDIVCNTAKKVETLEAENARLVNLLALANQELEKHL